MASDQSGAMTMAEFLGSRPPGGDPYHVTDLLLLTKDPGRRFSTGPAINMPDVRLHCSECDHPTNYGAKVEAFLTRVGDVLPSIFLHYECRNCRRSPKLFAVVVHRIDKADDGTFGVGGIVTKVGEMPAFAPRTPASLLRAFSDDDRRIFLKGRRCESQGLGIGAYSYYRRIVEEQKNWVFDRIILAVNAQPPVDETLIGELELAKKQVQFSSSVDAIRRAFPHSLLVHGHSPLLLLHRALSAGVHELTDEQCLARAHQVRLVLSRMVELIDVILHDDRELGDAVTALNKLERSPG